MDVTFETVLTIADRDVAATVGYDVIDRHYGRPPYAELISVVVDGVEQIEELDFADFNNADAAADRHLEENSDWEYPSFPGIDDRADDAYDSYRQDRIEGRA